MSKLDKFINEVQPSKGIFRINVNKEYIASRSRTLKAAERHAAYTGNDDLITVVCDNICESFNSRDGIYEINKTQTMFECLTHIRNRLLKFMEEEMPQKHPKETKMYRYFRDLDLRDMNQKMRNIFVELFVFLLDNDNVKNYNDRADQTMKVLKFIYAQNG